MKRTQCNGDLGRMTTFSINVTTVLWNGDGKPCQCDKVTTTVDSDNSHHYCHKEFPSVTSVCKINKCPFILKENKLVQITFVL